MITLKAEHNKHDTVTMTLHSHADLDEVFETVTNFLRAVGYVIPYYETLELVDNRTEEELASLTKEAMYRVAVGVDPMPAYNEATMWYDDAPHDPVMSAMHAIGKDEDPIAAAYGESEVYRGEI